MAPSAPPGGANSPSPGGSPCSWPDATTKCGTTSARAGARSKSEARRHPQGAWSRKRSDVQERGAGGLAREIQERDHAGQQTVADGRALLGLRPTLPAAERWCWADGEMAGTTTVRCSVCEFEAVVFPYWFCTYRIEGVSYTCIVGPAWCDVCARFTPSEPGVLVLGPRPGSLRAKDRRKKLLRGRFEEVFPSRTSPPRCLTCFSTEIQQLNIADGAIHPGCGGVLHRAEGATRVLGTPMRLGPFDIEGLPIE